MNMAMFAGVKRHRFAFSSRQCLMNDRQCSSRGHLAPTAVMKFSSFLVARHPPIRNTHTAVPAFPVKDAVKVTESTTASSAVPVHRGELLLYQALPGGTSRRALSALWLGSGVIWVYFAAAAGLAAVAPLPAAATAASAWASAATAAVGAGAVASAALSAAASAGRLRAAVLCADGSHVRLYAFSRAGAMRPGPAVTLPVRSCSLGAPTTARDAAPALALSLGGAETALILDKPAGAPLGVDTTPGTGLVWSAEGLAGIAVPGAAGGGIITPSAFAAAYPSAIAALRDYALLSRTLGGAPVVDMAAAREGRWELETMHSQLGGVGGAALATAASAPHSSGGQLRAVGELAYWRRARAPSGRDFWWHTLTWATRWDEPTVDGRGVYAWHPDSAVRDSAR